MRNRLGLLIVSSIALGAFVSISPTKAAAASDVRVCSVSVAASAFTMNSAVEPAYYYQGHRYPYRYGGRYYYHRRFRGGHWRYY